MLSVTRGDTDETIKESNMKIENVKAIEVPVYWYPDDDGNAVIDKEGMLEKFEELLEELV